MREWSTRFEHKYVAPTLSHSRRGGSTTGTLSSWRRFLSHINSVVAVATTLYSASVEDLATVHCFLDNHDIGLPPKKIMYAEVDVLSSQLPPQCASEYATKLRELGF